MNPAYHKARFRVGGLTEVLPPKFWVITAENPDGVVISGEENAARTEAFRGQLGSLGLEYFSVAGYDPDSPHREEGFAVVCDGVTAHSLGSQWEQEAIFRVENGEVILVSCADLAEEWPLGPWLARLDLG